MHGERSNGEVDAVGVPESRSEATKDAARETGLVVALPRMSPSCRGRRARQMRNARGCRSGSIIQPDAMQFPSPAWLQESTPHSCSATLLVSAALDSTCPSERSSCAELCG